MGLSPGPRGHPRPSALALFLIVGLVLASTPARAATTLDVVSRDEGSPDSRGERAFWITVGDNQTRNPDLRLSPGEEVTIRHENRGTQPHALVFREPIDVFGGVVEPGNATTIRFTVPQNATGATQYVCAFHRALGEGGGISFDGTEPTRDELAMERDDLIPYPPKRLTEYAFVGGQLAPAVLTVLAALLAARRRET